jgi:hypothetical protein
MAERCLAFTDGEGGEQLYCIADRVKGLVLWRADALTLALALPLSAQPSPSPLTLASGAPTA